MARPPVYDGSLRSRLLEVTAEIIDAHGIEAASLRRIAREAETSTAAVYALFGGRDELITAVIDEAFASFAAAQATAEPHGLRALGLAYRSWALEHPTLYRLMFSTSLAHIVTPTSSLPDESRSPLERTVARLLPDASPERITTATIAIWSQVHGVVSLQLTGMPIDGATWDAVYHEVLDLTAAAYDAS